MRRAREVIGALIGLLLLAACGPTNDSTPRPLPTPTPSPSVLPSAFASAWLIKCGPQAPLPPAGLLGIGRMPSVEGGGAQGQVWAAGLVRQMTLRKWADANNVDAVFNFGCIEDQSLGQQEVTSIAIARLTGGHVDYETGGISKLSVVKANAQETALAPGDQYAIVASGIGPTGLWVVNSQGARALQPGLHINEGTNFQARYLGHYDDQLGVWAVDGVFMCNTGASCA